MDALKRIVFAVILVVVLLGSATHASVHAQTPPDILDQYSIAITPQPDGTLVMAYSLQNYCAKSDWPGDYPYLQIGVPNKRFAISDWGAEGVMVVSAEPVNSGGTFVQMNFDRGNLPKNGNCFNLHFTIIQNKMAYTNDSDGTVTFKFIPAGWNFPIVVNTLTVLWTLPSDPTLIKLTDPAPSTSDAANVVWQWVNPPMNSAGMFDGATIRLAYDKSAFVLPADSSQDGVPTNDGGGNVSGGTILLIVLVVGIVFIVMGCWLYSNVSDDSYTKGSGYTPTYVPSTTYRPSTSHSSTSRPSTSRPASRPTPSYHPPSSPPPSHSSSGGGFGSSSGHSSSCACVSHCACACACAGGGRVGCSRKAIGVACLKQVIAEVTTTAGG